MQYLPTDRRIAAEKKINHWARAGHAGEAINHFDVTCGDLSGAPCFLAVIKGPGLPGNGDHRVSGDLWELCIDISTAIQEANPEFVAQFRLISQPGRQQPRWFT